MAARFGVFYAFEIETKWQIVTNCMEGKGLSADGFTSAFARH